MSRVSVSIPEFINAVRENFFGKDEFTIGELKAMPKQGIAVSGKIWECVVPDSRPRRFSISILEERYNAGEFAVARAPRIKESVQPKQIMENVNNVTNTAPSTVNNVTESMDSIDMYIPFVDPNFVPWGDNYSTIKTIVESDEFFPCYIYGVSGVGKTSSIEHVCGTLKRPFFRVQITSETVDEDLIGGMKLLNGDTVWQDGPIIKAYRCGGIVVLDECDLNSNLMILQPILEGKPFYIKQTGEVVAPAKGFTVFATGNTKGDGNDPRYIGTTTLNEAFLERFAITLEQTFPSRADETKIAKTFCKNNNINISQNLLKDIIKMVMLSRDGYKANGGDGAYISTRRISFILKAYKLTSDIDKALDMTLARYSDTDREALKMIWKSVHVNEGHDSDSEESTNDFEQAMKEYTNDSEPVDSESSVQSLYSENSDEPTTFEF